MEEGCGADQFPGFQTYAHKDDIVLKRSLSRLQRRAPCPLQLKPKVSSSSHGGVKSQGSCSNSSSPSSSSSSSSLSSFYHSKDPIPLLSPLVLPSLLESACIQQENATKSH